MPAKGLARLAAVGCLISRQSRDGRLGGPIAVTLCKSTNWARERRRARRLLLTAGVGSKAPIRQGNDDEEPGERRPRVVKVMAKAISELHDRSFSHGLGSGAEALRRPWIIESGQARVSGPSQGVSRKVHRWARRAVVVVALTVAAWAGAALGTASLTQESRFYAQRTAAQSGERILYGPPEVPGHPRAVAIERSDLIRQFVALDGSN